MAELKEKRGIRGLRGNAPYGIAESNLNNTCPSFTLLPSSDFRRSPGIASGWMCILSLSMRRRVRDYSSQRSLKNDPAREISIARTDWQSCRPRFAGLNFPLNSARVRPPNESRELPLEGSKDTFVDLPISRWVCVNGALSTISLCACYRTLIATGHPARGELRRTLSCPHYGGTLSIGSAIKWQRKTIRDDKVIYHSMNVQYLTAQLLYSELISSLFL